MLVTAEPVLITTEPVLVTAEPVLITTESVLVTAEPVLVQQSSCHKDEARADTPEHILVQQCHAGARVYTSPCWFSRALPVSKEPLLVQ